MRNAVENDLGAVVAIYNEAVPGRTATADTIEVTVEDRREWFRKHDPARYPLIVAEEHGRVVGWAGLQPFHYRPAYARTAEVSLYVSGACHRRGIGRALLGEILSRAPALGIDAVVALIFSHNAPSLRLFLSKGFVEWGLLPDVATLDGVSCSLSILGTRVG